MKLVIVGGGGIRTPLFIESLLKRQADSENLITHVTLHDLQAERLEVIETMARHLIGQLDSTLTIETTTDLDYALVDADFVVTTLRAGFEKGRILDEKVAIQNGCIGQETVGAGGFAMAMRSIPAVLNVAKKLAKASPNAWIINFTNPSGIITQALHDAGFSKSIGICDSADTIARSASQFYKVPEKEVDLKVYGLNHCSFAERVFFGRQDKTSDILADDGFMDSVMALYDKEELRAFNALPNEYLYYYFYAKQAFEKIAAEKQTRGEIVLALHKRFFEGARSGGRLRGGQELFDLQAKLLSERKDSYMEYAWEDTDQTTRSEAARGGGAESESEGYAGVALSFIHALRADKPRRLVINYPNGGAIDFFSHHDVAELTFEISSSEIKPLPVFNMPPKIEMLLKELKLYENLSCQACRTLSRRSALLALEVNPLVESREMAAALLDDYAKAHGGTIKDIAEGV